MSYTRHFKKTRSNRFFYFFNKKSLMDGLLGCSGPRKRAAMVGEVPCKLTPRHPLVR
jgi:hypothetical protein